MKLEVLLEVTDKQPYNGPLTLKVNGESHAFCCYGCCIAFQVKNGKSEEWEAAWLLIRLGVGAFPSMNIMLFSTGTASSAV